MRAASPPWGLLEAQGVPRSLLDTLCWACSIGDPQAFAWHKGRRGALKANLRRSFTQTWTVPSLHASPSVSEQPGAPLQMACVPGWGLGVLPPIFTVGSGSASLGIELRCDIHPGVPSTWSSVGRVAGAYKLFLVGGSHLPVLCHHTLLGALETL